MYLVLIAWIYVAFMMAIAEAMSPVGSILGAVFTFVLYGLLPMSVVGYIMGTPARRRTLKAKEAAEQAQASAVNGIQNSGDDETSVPPDARREAPRHTIAPERKEP